MDTLHLIVAILCVRRGLAFDEMYVEASQVTYRENLEAATKFHSYDFDDGMEILGFESDDIQFGNVVGKAQYDVAMFRGIKYATAERFGNSIPVRIPTDINLEAFRAGPSCPQPSEDYFEHPEDYTEDCLYLDIYIPLHKTVVATRQSENPADWSSRQRYTRYEDLPILIAFQGEDFTYVESRAVDGRVLARYGSVIVVVVNYRTGILGFLSSGDDNIPGNFGLRDQKIAIEWIKDNAKIFGGDPSSITLLGYSSGAECVSAQMYDPTNNKHIFQRVILQSGVTKIDSMFANNKTTEREIQRHLFSKIAEYVSCDANETSKCIRSAHIEDLIIAAGTLTYERGNNRTFGPMMEEKFSCDLVDISQYDIMIGTVEFEAGNIAEDLPKSQPLATAIGNILSYQKVFQNASGSLIDYLEFEYSSFAEISPDDQTAYGFVKAATDFEYTVPAINFAKKLSSLGAITYTYLFSPRVTNLKPGKPYFIEDRAVHGEDQKYLFGLPLLLVQLFQSGDRNISANYIRMISNFVHTGDPNEGPTNKPNAHPVWVPFDASTMGTYMISNKMEMKYNAFVKTMSVWTHAVPYLIDNSICAESEKVTCTKSTSCKASWEASYREWKNVDLPRWKERFQEATDKIDSAKGL